MVWLENGAAGCTILRGQNLFLGNHWQPDQSGAEAR